MSRLLSHRTIVAAGAVLALTAVTPSALARTVTKTATTTATGTAAVSPTSPLRLVSSAAPVVSAGGADFAPDAGYALGGTLVTSSHVITATASPQLYQSARAGLTGYDIPVTTAGTYFVDLFVAETQGAAPGQRVWNLTGEGHALVSDVDVAAQAGPDKAWHVLAPVVVTDGMLNLRLHATVGQPMVAAVDVLYESSATSASTLLSDDFNGPAGTPPNQSTWGYDVGGNGWGSAELESYTSRTSNAALDGAGHLSITARKETYTGADGITRYYTSARLTTLGKFSFRYGTAVARVRVPGGTGLWPAFWGEGTDVNTDGWPLCGEMDVMENIGSAPATAYQTLHAGTNTAGNWAIGTAPTASSALSAGYHTYGITWGPGAVSMQLDDRTTFALSVYDLQPGAYWNFGHPFFLMLNLAVGGGGWAGTPDSTTAFPAVMSVDYVRVTG